MSTPEPSVPSLGVIEDLDWWGLKHVVVKLAMEMDLFSAVAAAGGWLQEIAAAIGANQRGVRILLDALCPLGLLSRSEGVYSLTPTAEAHLVRGKLTYCADAYLTFWRDRDRLAEAVRTGRASLDIPGPQAEELWANLAAPELLAWPHGVAMARERWAQLGIPGRRGGGCTFSTSPVGLGLRALP